MLCILQKVKHRVEGIVDKDVRWEGVRVKALRVKVLMVKILRVRVKASNSRWEVLRREERGMVYVFILSYPLTQFFSLFAFYKITLVLWIIINPPCSKNLNIYEFFVIFRYCHIEEISNAACLSLWFTLILQFLMYLNNLKKWRRFYVKQPHISQT